MQLVRVETPSHDSTEGIEKLIHIENFVIERWREHDGRHCRFVALREVVGRVVEEAMRRGLYSAV